MSDGVERRPGRCAAGQSRCGHPVQERVQVGELDVARSGAARGVVVRVERLRAHLADHDLVPATAMRSGARHQALHVGERDGAGRVGPRREPVRRREGLGPRRAGGRQPARCTSVTVPAPFHDALDRRVVRAAGIGEANRGQAVIQDGSPVVAYLGGRVGVGGEVLRVDRLATDVVASRGEGSELGPGHEARRGADRARVHEERGMRVVRLQGLLVGQVVLTDRVVVEGEADLGHTHRSGLRRRCDISNCKKPERNDRSERPCEQRRPPATPSHRTLKIHVVPPPSKTHVWDDARGAPSGDARQGPGAGNQQWEVVQLQRPD